MPTPIRAGQAIIPFTAQRKEAIPRMNNDKKDVIVAKILRFDPSCDTEPYFQTYEVPKYTIIGRQTVAKVLEYIFENLDPSLSFYLTCDRGICDGCAAMVNGKAELVCMKETTDEVTIEPIQNHKIIRDLVVMPEEEDRLRRRTLERSGKSKYL
jgi:succinate dehydrogenase/fumarate reductase-like Fe-S protein